jgi:isopenicillin-N epimerase
MGERPSHSGSVPRRTFLGHLPLAAGATALGCREDGTSDDTAAVAVGEPNDSNRWSTLRQQFPLSPDHVHMSALLIASHPAPVSAAIARYRDELDRDPVLTLREHNRSRQRAVQEAAAAYLGADGDDIALTDSTTMGVGLTYNGLRLRPGDEILTTTQDYYVTHEAARQAANRYGGEVRQIDLYDYDEIAGVSQEQLVDTVARSIGDRTRVVALTWVHSSTGLKLPLAPLGDAIAEASSASMSPVCRPGTP